MAQICPHCGSKYTVDKGISNNTRELSHKYYCENCKRTFEVATGAKAASGKWLMTFWNVSSTSNCKTFISVYKTSDGKIQINQSYKDPQTDTVSYHSGEITPRIGIESSSYATGKKYYLSIATKQGMLSGNGVCFRFSRIDMNPELERNAKSNEAMSLAFQHSYNCPAFYFEGSENRSLLEDQRVYLQSVLGTPSGSSISDSNYGPCYIATAVYGSYNCPEVWTLRRFRDNTLASTWYGRAFIRTYYAISPTLVKWFGHTAWFKNLWRGKLDKMVDALQKQGIESTPYQDKNW